MRWVTRFVVFGLVCSCGLASAQEAPKPVRLNITEDHIKDNCKTIWYAVYMKNKRFGYVMTKLEKGTYKGKPAYVEGSVMLLLSKSGEATRELHITTESIFSGEAPYPLQEATEVIEEKREKVKNKVEVRLFRDGETFQVTTVAGKNTNKKKIGDIDYTLADAITTDVWEKSKPKVREKIYYRSFSMSNLEVKTKVRELIGTKKIKYKGIMTTVREFHSKQLDEKSRLIDFVDAEGKLLLSKLGGFELRRESAKTAKNLDAPTDFFEDSLVKIDRGLKMHPHKVHCMIVEIKAKKPSAIPNGPWQTVIPTTEGTVICMIGKKYGKKTKATPKELKENLRATLTYPAQNPRIKKLAAKAIGDAKTDREKVQRLVKFVKKFIRPSYEGKGTLVLSLLDNPCGDCTAYASLFTTLARAAGIPSREVGGFAYMGDLYKKFGGHAWNQVVIDGYWHPIDASTGAFEIDGARVCLGADRAGNDSLFENYGTMSFRLVEVQPKQKKKEKK